MAVVINQSVDAKEIQYKYIFNDRGDEGHGRFVMGEDRWGLSKAANHDMCIMDCLVSSTATDEEGLDIQKFAKSNILWTNRVYMLSRTTNKQGGQPGYVEHDYQQEMYSLRLREFVWLWGD